MVTCDSGRILVPDLDLDKPCIKKAHTGYPACAFPGKAGQSRSARNT